MSFPSQNALMRAAIDELGGRAALTPVPEAALAGLTLPDGGPLPVSLRLWLAASDRWPSGLPALVDGALPFKPMGELVGAALAEAWPGHGLTLASSEADATILYVGRRSRGGRCAVLTVEGARVSLRAPGLAFYVASYSELPSQVGTALYAAAHTAFRELLQGRI